jgi:hypothetical protein
VGALLKNFPVPAVNRFFSCMLKRLLYPGDLQGGGNQDAEDAKNSEKINDGDPGDEHVEDEDADENLDDEDLPPVPEDLKDEGDEFLGEEDPLN